MFSSHLVAILVFHFQLQRVYTGHAKYLPNAQIRVIKGKRSNSLKRHSIRFMEHTTDSEMEEMLQQQECSPGGLWEEHTPCYIQGRFGGSPPPL